MQKGFKIGVVTALLLSLSGCFSAEEEQVEDVEPEVARLNVALGKVEGVNYAAGTAVCVALKKSGSELPCKLMASEGSEQNLLAITSGQVDLALVRADSAYQAWHGKKPFSKRSTKLRVLFSLHHEMVTLLISRGANILSFSHIADKLINIGSKESSNSLMVSNLLNSCQIALGDNFSYKDNGTLPEMLSNGEAVGGFEMLSHPEDKLKILTNNVPLQFLPITGHCVEQFIDNAPYMDAVKIPGNLYKGLPSDIPTVGSKIWLVASSELPDAAVYDVVKAIFEGVEQFRRSDPAFYHLSPRKMLSSFSIPYHMGAVQYFQEMGWYSERR
jgi:uncharacterized protein